MFEQQTSYLFLNINYLVPFHKTALFAFPNLVITFRTSIQVSPKSQLRLQPSHIHPLALLNCGTARDVSLRLAGCSTVVMIDRLPLLSKVFLMTLPGQISYVEEGSGVVFGPAD